MQAPSMWMNLGRPHRDKNAVRTFRLNLEIGRELMLEVSCSHVFLLSCITLLCWPVRPCQGGVTKCAGFVCQVFIYTGNPEYFIRLRFSEVCDSLMNEIVIREDGSWEGWEILTQWPRYWLVCVRCTNHLLERTWWLITELEKLTVKLEN